MGIQWALGNSCIKDQGTDIRTVEQTTSPSKLGHTQTKLLSNQPYQPWFNQNLIHRSEGGTWLAENVGFIWIHLNSKCYCGWLRNPASLWMVVAPYHNDGINITYQLVFFGFRNHPPYVCLLDTTAVVVMERPHETSRRLWTGRMCLRMVGPPSPCHQRKPWPRFSPWFKPWPIAY